MFLFWNKQRNCAALVLLSSCLMTLCGPSYAQVTLSGFATLGVTASSSDEFIFRSAINRWPEEGTNLLTESLIGLQVNYQVNDKVDVVVQSILDNKNYDSLSDYIDLAFIRYQIDRNYSVRFGRLNNNAYILSEYLEVGYSYLWATPPMEFYTPSSYLTYIDGIELQYRNLIGDGMLQATLAMGNSKADLLNVDSVSVLEYDYVLNSSVTYETDHWLFKGTFSHFHGHKARIEGLDQLQDLAASYPSQWWPFMGELLQSLDFKDQSIQYVALGVNYHRDNWLVKSEVAYFNIDWGLTGDLGYGYISVGYEFEEITPYMTFAILDSLYDRHIIEQPRYDLIDDPQTQQTLAFLQSNFQTLYDSARMDQHSVSLGMRWDFTPRWVAKGQVTYYKINGPGSGLWGGNSLQSIDDHRHVNVLSLNVSTIF